MYVSASHQIDFIYLIGQLQYAICLRTHGGPVLIERCRVPRVSSATRVQEAGTIATAYGGCTRVVLIYSCRPLPLTIDVDVLLLAPRASKQIISLQTS